jgi:BON domain-containing protein
VSRADLLLALMEPPGKIGAEARDRDERIREALRKEVHQQPWAESLWSFADVEDGVITLYGFVRTDAVRRGLRVLASRIDGVERVEDRMEDLPVRMCEVFLGAGDGRGPRSHAVAEWSAALDRGPTLTARGASHGRGGATMRPNPPVQAGQDETVALLSRPDTYGVDAVEMVETHISRVFLAGDRAYKLKKAVRFSYLDYSTPELRLAACRAELTVNRRFAPGLHPRVHRSSGAQTAPWRWTARDPRRIGPS